MADMSDVTVPFTDWSPRLSARWANLDPPAQVALIALLGLLPLLLVLWLYCYELRLVRGRTAALLLGLRLLVVGLLWFVVAWEPVLTHSTVVEIPGRVVVAIDRSASMNAVDPQRTTAEKLRLARALDVEGAASVAALVDGWIRHHEAKGDAEPVWIAPEEARADPARARQLAEERRALHGRITAAVERLTRAEVARRLLADSGAALLGAIAAKHEVELLAFDREAWELRPGQLDEAAKPRAGGAFTDLRMPLLRARERDGPDRARTLGVVLLTDGQHNHGDTPLKEAAELAARGVPVFPVALGAKQPPADIALVEVSAPASALKDVDVSVEARFRVSGVPAQELVVELRRGKGNPPPEHVKRVQHDGTNRVYSVPFQVRLGEAGLHKLEAHVRPARADTREASEDNNRRAAAVRVVDDRARVLLVDGEARWEYHYLATALRRDRGVAADLVVFVQPRVGRIAEAELEKAGNPRLTLPKKDDKDDPLLKYDCVILGDVAPEQLPPEDRRRLERYVADRGGTLVVLAGKRSMPLAYAEEAGADDDPLLKMLPVERPRAVGPAQGFPVTLTHEGRQAPFLQLDAAPEESARRWAELPRHHWALVGRAKPGAVVLACVADGAPKDDKDGPEKTQALIVRHNYGFGRVLLVGLDSTWRWRYRVGDTYHHRFWGQLVRWAASDQLLPAGNRYVRYGSRDPVYRHGQEVGLAARLEDEAPLPPGAPAAARVYHRGADGKEEAVALVELGRGERNPRLLEGAVRDLPPGEYRVELHIPALEDKIKAPPDGAEEKDQPRRDVFTVLEAEGSETVNLATNWPLLEALAVAGKGKLLTPETAGQLAGLLAPQVKMKPHVDRQQPWEDAPLVWVTLGVLLLLLTAEWVGRKLAGLP